MRFLLVVFFCLCFSFLLKSIAFSDSIVFPSRSYFPRTNLPPSSFDHDNHNSKALIDDCSECHHVYDELGFKIPDQSSEEQACAECHYIRNKKGSNLRKIFHQACRGCHKKDKIGPVTCKKCHYEK